MVGATEKGWKEIEEDFSKKRNIESRSRLEKEYLEIKNIGIILIDLVPYERKGEMIGGLGKLFRSEAEKGSIVRPYSPESANFEVIPDIKEEGIMSGGGWANIGIIHNSDLEGPFITGVQKKLPKQISNINVSLGQFVESAYYVIYSCLIKEDYQTENIKKTFVESQDFVPYSQRMPDGSETHGEKPKGPDLEPSIRRCQENVENFLREFSFGLYLNKDTRSQHCPNLKVLSIPKIDFEHFSAWEKEHIALLRFVGFDFLYSQSESMLTGYYRERIFAQKQNSASQGLLFLGSLGDLKGEGFQKPEHEVLYRVENMLLRGLAPFMHLTYWPNFAVEIVQREKEKELDTLLESIQSLKTKKTVHKDAYDKMLDANQNANRYFIEEIRNIGIMRQNSGIYGDFVKNCKPLESIVPTNVFKGLVETSERLMKLERDALDNLKERYELTLSYCNNMTNVSLQQSNLSLQKSMQRMTIAILFLTVVSIIIPVLDKYGSLIWKFLTN